MEFFLFIDVIKKIFLIRMNCFYEMLLKRIFDFCFVLIVVLKVVGISKIIDILIDRIG